MLAAILALALAAPPRIAVMPLRAGSGIEPADAAAVTQALVGEVRRRSGGEVITEGEIASILTMEQQKRMLGCSTDACMAELGGALGVGRLVTGDVARLGESLMVHVRVIDSTRVRVLAQADRRFKKGGYDDVLDALPAMVAELFAAEQRTASAAAPPPTAAPSPAAPSPAAKPAEARALERAADFRPPQGMLAIHVRAPKDLGLVAWSDEPSADGTKVFKRYVTSSSDHMPPSGATDFGLFWLVPAAEFKAGTARFGFVVPSRMQFGEGLERGVGKGCCGPMSWALAGSSQVWIDPRECKPHGTIDEVLAPGRSAGASAAAPAAAGQDATRPPAGKPARSVATAAGFTPPDGMIAVHLRASEDRELVAWAVDPAAGKDAPRRPLTRPSWHVEPSGSTDFGLYWFLPVAELKSGRVGLAFVRPSSLGWSEKSSWDPPWTSVGRQGACGEAEWIVSATRQVWIDARCRLHRTREEALGAK